jgi:hypothetical protein
MTTERASSIQGVIARDSIVARRRPIADFFNSIGLLQTSRHRWNQRSKYFCNMG